MSKTTECKTKYGGGGSKVKTVDYHTLLRMAQEYMTSNYAALIADTSDNRTEVVPYLEQFYCQSDYKVESMTVSDIGDRLYNDMCRYSILTKYLDTKRNDIEEVNINAWNDITIHKDTGEVIKLDETFFDANHAVDVIKRMLNKSGMLLDMAKPTVRGFLGKNIRLTVVARPIVDNEIGVAVSIRIVNPKKLQKDDFIKNGTATEKMLDFICNCLRYNVSSCITGSTGSGKTTLMSWILSTIPNQKRVVTIEEGVREFNLIKKDENGRVINNVVHMVTRDSDNEKERITSDMLVTMSLTMNPDVLVVAEMKDSEAWAAQEAARTGHAVITTVHANSAEATYDRMATLCLGKHDVNYGVVGTLVREAFPIVVYAKRLEDNSRRIMNISECIIEDGKSKISTLYEFVITKNNYKDGKCVIEGHYAKVNTISKRLQKLLMENGMPEDILKSILEV